MTDKIIEAARQAEAYATSQTTDIVDWKAIAQERFYAIAYQQGMEHLASEAIDTVARHGGSVEIEAAIRALPSQQDHFADANTLVGRHTLQAQGKHPAPCARFCEANAFRIEERQQARLIAELEAKVKALSLDAARYRELRHIESSIPAAVYEFLADTGGPDPDKILVGGHLDSFCEIHMNAIDDAIAAQKDGQAEGEPT
jgi:hypothetical protein